MPAGTPRSPFPAGAADVRPKLAVMTLDDRTGDLSAALVDGLTDYLRMQMALRGGYLVIDKSRQAAALKRLAAELRRESYATCVDQSCQIPLGRRLSADTLLRCGVTRIGSAYQLNAELVDLAREATFRAAQAEVKVQPTKHRDDRLKEAVRRLARELAGELPGGAGETVSLGGLQEYGVSVAGGEGTASAPDGVVRFGSTPPGAWVTVDGRGLARPTPVEELLPLGEHEVVFGGVASYERFAERLVLRAGQVVRVRLRPITGEVVLQARDGTGNLLRNVRAFLDGEEVAQAPVRLRGVLVGWHRLRLVADGYRDREMELNVARDEALELTLVLERNTGELELRAPALVWGKLRFEGRKGEVLLDGERVGETPLKVTLPTGTHQVTVRGELGRTQGFDVTVRHQETAVLEPVLEADTSAPGWQGFLDGEMAERRGLYRRRCKSGNSGLAMAGGLVPVLREFMVLVPFRAFAAEAMGAPEATPGGSSLWAFEALLAEALVVAGFVGLENADTDTEVTAWMTLFVVGWLGLPVLDQVWIQVILPNRIRASCLEEVGLEHPPDSEASLPRPFLVPAPVGAGGLGLTTGIRF